MLNIGLKRTRSFSEQWDLGTLNVPYNFNYLKVGTQVP